MDVLAAEQLIGKMLGNFQVERLLGRGRLNAVYLARSRTTQKTVALTLYIIPEWFSSDARTRFLRRFRKEAGALIMLRHKHILPVYEYGEYADHPYLITPYMMYGSLADVLKREGPGTHQRVLEVLEQMAEGLMYAHGLGVIHGMLKPSNIVMSGERTIQVAGFGLMHIQQLQGIERTDQNEQPYAHLLSIARTLLVAPEYIAPEVVQGQSIDMRSDIYALGAILFELLSGRPLFTGEQPLEVARKHVEQEIPSLHALCPHIPVGLESVLNQALERNPRRRFQSVSDLAEAFAQVSRGATSATQQSLGKDTKPLEGLGKSRDTRPLEKPNRGSATEEQSTGSWQFTPPIITGKLPVITSSRSERHQAPSSVQKPDPTSAKLPTVPSEARSEGQRSQRLDTNSAKMAAGEPEPDEEKDKTDEWWMHPSPDAPFLPHPALSEVHTDTSKSVRANKERKPHAKASGYSGGLAQSKIYSNGEPKRVRRRRVVALLATGSIVAGGVAVAANMQLLRTANEALLHAQDEAQNTPEPRGEVIGSTKLTANSAVVFTNPTNGEEGLLIRLANGKFVAYERTCPHAGIKVNYEAATQKLVCPAHNAIFDPANKSAILGGPVKKPLPEVVVHVNDDGTITTG